MFNDFPKIVSRKIILKQKEILIKEMKKKLKSIEILQENLKKIFLMVIEKLVMGDLIIIQNTGLK